MNVAWDRDVRGGLVWLAVLATLFFVVPGYPRGAVTGLPLGPAGTMAVSAIVIVAVVFRHARMRRSVVVAAAVAMAALLLGRIVTSAATERHGWVARYFANDNWSGAPEWSSDFRMPDATRIDDRIAFKDDTLPAHYLNDPAFNRGIRRQVSEPISVDLRAHASVAPHRPPPIALRARGG